MFFLSAGLLWNLKYTSLNHMVLLFFTSTICDGFLFNFICSSHANGARFRMWKKKGKMFQVRMSDKSNEWQWLRLALTFEDKERDKTYTSNMYCYLTSTPPPKLRDIHCSSIIPINATAIMKSLVSRKKIPIWILCLSQINCD